MKVKGGIWWNRWWTIHRFFNLHTQDSSSLLNLHGVLFALTRLGCGRLHFTEGMIVMVPMLGNPGGVVHALLKDRGRCKWLLEFFRFTSQDGIPVQLSVVLSYFCWTPRVQKKICPYMVDLGLTSVCLLMCGPQIELCQWGDTWNEHVYRERQLGDTSIWLFW